MGHGHSEARDRASNHNHHKTVPRSLRRKSKKSKKSSNVHKLSLERSQSHHNQQSSGNSKKLLRFRLRLSQSGKSSQSSMSTQLSSSAIPSIDSQLNSVSASSMSHVSTTRHRGVYRERTSSALPSLNIITDTTLNCDAHDVAESENINTIREMMVDLLKHKNNVHNSPISKLKNNSKVQTAADYEKFFIAFHQKQQQNKDDMSVYNTAIQHRVAFVSLIGLYQSFRRIPTHILFSSIFVLKIKREWLYQPEKYVNDDNNVLHKLHYDKDEEFVMLLKWKDSQSLLFFMYRDSQPADNNGDEQQQQQQQQGAIDDDDDNELPADFGIDDEDDAEEEAEEMHVNHADAFAFAANLPIASPTHSMHSINEQCLQEMAATHHPSYLTVGHHEHKDGNIDNTFNFNINMHEIDMTSFANRVSLSNSDSNEAKLPMTPSDSNDVNNFVPPLRLQRNDQPNMARVSQYQLPQIDEDHHEVKQSVESLKFDFIDNDEEEMLNFSLDEDEEDDDEDTPPLRLTLGLEHKRPVERGQCEQEDVKDDDNDEDDHDAVPLTPDFVPMVEEDSLEVDAIWTEISSLLSTVYDPFEGCNYSSLILDKNWWMNEFANSQYGASCNDILEELAKPEMNYRCVMEILFQSNPSLIPCKTYRELENVSSAIHSRPRPKKIELDEINLISNTTSMTIVDSSYQTDWFEPEYSNQIIDHDDMQTCFMDEYDSNLPKFTDCTPLQSLGY